MNISFNRILTRLGYILIVCLLWANEATTQSIHINGDRSDYHLFDRMQVLNGSTSNIHSSIQDLNRKAVLNYYASIYKGQKSPKDQFQIEHYMINNQEYLSVKNNSSDKVSPKYIDSSNVFYTLEKNELEPVFKRHSSKPILKYFYKSPAKFFEINRPNFKLSINPIIHFIVGKEVGNNSPVFQNLRGLELSGFIDDKVYFYTNILENQQLFNNYTEDWINDYKAVPRSGFYKPYQSGVSDRLHGWDILNSQAYVGVKVSKSIHIEFGHGRHFIGNGVRSLLLSDNSNNYFYLKFNTKIWKFNYQNIFAELSALSSKVVIGDRLIPKKYFAAHYLSYKPWNNVEVGLFETIIFSRENHFEFQYLNPLIFYRTAEQLVGSPDNILLGINANWNLWRKISVYGQLVLDEFKLKELIDQTGWWGNKYGVQLGLKYFNVLNIDQLDLQLEYNMVRPYTYSHGKSIAGYDYSLASYSNYNQPMAHPRGANFRELLIHLGYRPINKLLLKLGYMYTTYGEDGINESGVLTNYGTNILKKNSTREQIFGNIIGQGYATSVSMLSFDASYELFQNYHLDLHYIYRDQQSELDKKTISTNYFGGGIRINIGQLRIDY